MFVNYHAVNTFKSDIVDSSTLLHIIIMKFTLQNRHTLYKCHDWVQGFWWDQDFPMNAPVILLNSCLWCWCGEWRYSSLIEGQINNNCMQPINWLTPLVPEAIKGTRATGAVCDSNSKDYSRHWDWATQSTEWELPWKQSFSCWWDTPLWLMEQVRCCKLLLQFSTHAMECRHILLTLSS